MDFQAIICCGEGKNLGPFSGSGQHRISKALLPIANKPMVHYSLAFCDKAAFSQILVVTDSSTKDAVEQYVKDYKTIREGGVSSPIEVVSSDIEGTGAIIKWMFDQGKITKDFVVMPCDFVTDVPPELFIEQYRNREANVIGMASYYKNSFSNVDEKKGDLKYSYTCYSKDGPGDHQLLDSYSKQAVVKSKFLELRTHMVWRHGCSLVSGTLLDSGIYFCSLKVQEILQDESYDFQGKSMAKVVRDLARRSWQHSQELEKVGMFFVPSVCTFARADSLLVYLEANRWVMMQQHNKNVQAGMHPPAKKDKLAPSVGPESLILPGTTLDERTNVKKSIIGDNCVIGKRCKIIGCVILGNTVISDDVLLENCIVGADVKIESKSKLLNCNVEGGYTVLKGAQVKGETLLVMTLLVNDRLQEEDDEDDEDSDEESDYLDDGDDYEDDFDGDDLFER